MDLELLQAARLKGRLGIDSAAASARRVPDEVRPALDELTASGMLKSAGPAYALTPQGREHLAALLAHERGTLDNAGLAAAYADYDEFNTSLKELIVAWQMKEPGEPNDHTDSAYDRAIMDRLSALNRDFRPLLHQIIDLVPRLSVYTARFDDALEKVVEGDHSMIASPLKESYHTVWFELHEELIGVLGLTRADEAAAGRAI